MFFLKLIGLVFAFLWTLVLDSDGGDPPPDPPDDPPAGSPGEPLFVARNQKDLDKKFGEEKRAAAEAKEHEIAESFGVSLDEARQIIADHKEAKQATETEVERLQRETETKEQSIATANQERDAARLELKTERVTRRLENALRAEGVQEKYLKPSLRLADTEALINADEVTDELIAQTVGQVKEESPVYFEEPKTERASIPLSPNGAGGGSKLSHEEREARAFSV
jgi:hypothetical protein